MDHHHSTIIPPPLHHAIHNASTTPSYSLANIATTTPSYSLVHTATTTPSYSLATSQQRLHHTPHNIIKLATTPPPSPRTTTNGTVWTRSPRGGMEARQGRGVISRRSAGSRKSGNGTRVFPPFSPAYCLPRSDSRSTSPRTGWGRGDPSRGSKVRKGGGLFLGE